MPKRKLTIKGLRAKWGRLCKKLPDSDKHSLPKGLTLSELAAACDNMQHLVHKNEALSAIQAAEDFFTTYSMHDDIAATKQARDSLDDMSPDELKAFCKACIAKLEAEKVRIESELDAADAEERAKSEVRDLKALSLRRLYSNADAPPDDFSFLETDTGTAEPDVSVGAGAEASVEPDVSDECESDVEPDAIVESDAIVEPDAEPNASDETGHDARDERGPDVELDASDETDVEPDVGYEPEPDSGYEPDVSVNSRVDTKPIAKVYLEDAPDDPAPVICAEASVSTAKRAPKDTAVKARTVVSRKSGRVSPVDNLPSAALKPRPSKPTQPGQKITSPGQMAEGIMVRLEAIRQRKSQRRV
jgi:hypothetical protein